MLIALGDMEFTKKALHNFICRTVPGTEEEMNNIKILCHHPFFRLWGSREMDYKTEEYYAGKMLSPLSAFCSPDVFGELQAVFENALFLLKHSSSDNIRCKLESIARVKEISNLRLEAISQILGQPEMSHFLHSRKTFMDNMFPRQLTIVMTYDCNLNCNYCFSKSLAETEPGYLDSDVFERIISWMDGKGFRRVSLFGGEPTIHPDFIQYLKRLNNLEYGVYFSTNGLYSDDVAYGLNEAELLKVSFSISTSGAYTERQENCLRKNLKCLSSHIRKSFRFTLSEDNRNFTLLENLIDEFNPDALGFALAFPSEDYSNDFIDRDKMSVFADDILKLMAIARVKNLYCGLVKPIPLCKFNEGELIAMLSGMDMLGPCDIHHDDFMQLTTVSHKGVFYPCIALRGFGKIKIADNPSLDDISRYNRSVVEQFLKNPVFKECSVCNLFKSHLCQGFCYSYFSNS
ncbi:MAG: radical SAM protein [Syntrophaceae bacterium]